MANSVTLRKRKLPSGNIQLYLDCNIGGIRRTEGLGMVLLSGTDRATKQKNRETLEIAESIAKQRQIEAIERANGIEIQRAKGCEIFFDYYKECADRRSLKTRDDWYSALNHIERFERNKYITLAFIDRQWVERFRRYLLNDAVTITGKGNISRNTAAAIFAKLRACLHDAINDGIIDRDPAGGVPTISIMESERSFLTSEELQAISKAYCRDEQIKRAFLFCCLTGLRFSDVRGLRWGSIQKSDGRARIVFRQRKTGEQMYLDINELAEGLLGERTDGRDCVFMLRTNTYANAVVREWAENAGITKHITFHCSRHTCATLLITKGVDLYTTSKILGHTKIQTTQIYAKVIDSKRREAADALNDVF